MKAGGQLVKEAEHLAGEGIDWLEEKEKATTSWLVAKTDGIPLLGKAVKAGAAVADFSTEISGGALRGATGLVGGLAGMVVNPVDTAKGLEAMLEHAPLLPGVPNPLKAIHGLIDVANGDKSWGELADSLSPGASMKQDTAFWKTVGSGFIAPYAEQWNKGKYGDVIGRAGFDIASLFVGAGEANAASKLGAAARLGEAADVAKLAEAAKVAEAAKGAEAAKIGEAAKAADVVEAAKAAGAGGLAKAAETGEAAKAGDAAKVAEGADVARAAEAADVSAVADLTGMRVERLGQVTDELSQVGEAELDALLSVVDEGGAKSSTFFEMPGQNPATGGGLQDIVERVSPNPNQIAHNVNHYFGDTKVTSISEPVAIDTGRVPGSNVIPPGGGVPGATTPETGMVHSADDAAVLNAAGEPIGRHNVEVRAHSTNPAHPQQGPTVQVNTPSDKFGWAGDKGVAVKGSQSRYLLPDGTWKTIAEMTPQERAAAHWPTGG